MCKIQVNTHMQFIFNQLKLDISNDGIFVAINRNIEYNVLYTRPVYIITDNGTCNDRDNVHVPAMLRVHSWLFDIRTQCNIVNIAWGLDGLCIKTQWWIGASGVLDVHSHVINGNVPIPTPNLVSAKILTRTSLFPIHPLQFPFPDCLATLVIDAGSLSF